MRLPRLWIALRREMDVANHRLASVFDVYDADNLISTTAPFVPFSFPFQLFVRE